MTDYERALRDIDIKHYRWNVEHFRYRQRWPRKFIALWAVLLLFQVSYGVSCLLSIGGWLGVAFCALFAGLAAFSIYEIRVNLKYISDSRATELDYRQKLIDMGAEV